MLAPPPIAAGRTALLSRTQDADSRVCARKRGAMCVEKGSSFGGPPQLTDRFVEGAFLHEMKRPTKDHFSFFEVGAGGRVWGRRGG